MKNRTIRLLLVDNNKADLEAFGKYVKDTQLPYEYLTAESIAEAEGILRSAGFDVIIADFVLGDGTSHELLCQFGELPFIVTVEAGNEEVAKEALKMGACDYLIKDPEGNYLKILPSTVELALRHSRNEKELQGYRERLESMVEERTNELRKSLSREIYLTRIIEKSINEIVLFDTQNYRILFANEGACMNTGYSKAELMKMIPLDILKQLGAESFEKIVAPVKEGRQKRVVFETIIIRKDGSSYPVEIYLERAKYRNRPVYSAIVLDISKRKEIEETYRELVEGTNDLIVQLDAEANILYVNHMAQEITGLAPEELIGQHGFQFVHPDDRAATEAWFNACVKKKVEQGSIETRIVNKQSGAFFDLLWTVNFHHDKQGLGLYANGIAHDITERKKVETAIRRSEEQWNRTFHSFTDIVILQDADMQIVKANQAACTILGLHDDEIAGRRCFELFHGSSEPCNACPVQEAKTTLKPCTGEIYHDRLGKSFLISAAPILGESGRLEFLAFVAKDISKQKMLEHQLHQSQKMEAVGTLAGGIAHDFNNILSAIIGYAELIKDDLAVESDSREDIDEIIDSAKRGAVLVSKILTFSRQADVEKKPVSPGLIVAEVLNMLRSTLPSSIGIEESVEQDCGLVFMNPTSLHKVVINLCANSLQAMNDKKGVLGISLQQRELDAEEIQDDMTVSPGSYVVISVSDNGRGMKQETIDRIFEPYFTTMEPGKGTGMGLSLVHGIVQDANGSIDVKSVEDKGTTFTVWLPLLAEKTVTDHQADTTPFPGDVARRILAVDDEPILLRVIKRQLENKGYQVTTISSSEDALEAIRSDPDGFDLLITDQTMPKLSGINLAEKIKEIQPALPIIICTGHSDKDTREKAHAMGIRKIVHKPVAGDELTSAVHSVLGG